MRWLAILGVIGYRLVLRPFMRRRCLFDPSCSAFAIAMFRRVGFLHGLKATRARLHQCKTPARLAWTVGEDGKPEILALTPADGVTWTEIPARLMK